MHIPSSDGFILKFCLLTTIPTILNFSIRFPIGRMAMFIRSRPIVAGVTGFSKFRIVSQIAGAQDRRELEREKKRHNKRKEKRKKTQQKNARASEGKIKNKTM